MGDDDFFINISGLRPVPPASEIPSVRDLPKTHRGIKNQRMQSKLHQNSTGGTPVQKKVDQAPVSGKRRHAEVTPDSTKSKKKARRFAYSQTESKMHDSSIDGKADIHKSRAPESCERKVRPKGKLAKMSKPADHPGTKEKSSKKKKVKHSVTAATAHSAASQVGTPRDTTLRKYSAAESGPPKTKNIAKTSAPLVSARSVPAPGEPIRKKKISKKTASTSFNKLSLHESLVRQLDYLSFKQCTPIQALAVPAAMDGKRDVLIRAATGTGKTLAFLLPTLHQLLHLPPAQRERKSGTLVLVFSPTKELALQTMKVSQDLLRMVPSAVCGAVAGGEKPKSEKARLRKGLTVLCATPGRLAYHLESTSMFATAGLRWLVLDEADRLLDLGFEPQIRRIYKMLREARENHGMAQEAIGREVPQFALQSLLVSATLTPAVKRLASFCLRKDAFWADPDTLAIDGSNSTEGDLAFSVPKALTQWYCVVPCKERLVALIAAIISRTSGAVNDNSKRKKAIVFFSSNASVDFHHDVFKDADWPSISGFVKDRPSEQRKPRKLDDGFIGFTDDQEEAEEDESMNEDEEEEEEDDVKNGSEKKSGNGKKGKRGKIFLNTPLFKLHGSLDKEERAGHINDFSKAVGGVLLASDAASRGLDFPQIDWIIQYDPPQRIEEYLHRIGRTARIGRAGNALLFLQPSERGFLDVLQSHGVANLKELESSTLPGALLRCGAPEDLSQSRDFGQLLSAHLASHVASYASLLKLARSAFLSALRSYRSFPRELRSAFPFHELHTGHFASSFALRETPEEASRLQRRGKGKSKGKGEGKGKGKTRGKGHQATLDEGNMTRPHRKMREPRASDEFA